MRKLTSKSSRFARSFNYTMPEYRNLSPKARKSTISVVAPASHNRAPGAKHGRAEERS
jgi:hypothetical protein